MPETFAPRAFKLRFDRQAETFDRRAGLPPGVPERIAETLLELCSAQPRTAGHRGCVLELGAGTGEIGTALAARAPGYLAVDVSLAMLGVFGRRSGGASRLARADAGRSWPVRDGCAEMIFLSRAAHLLNVRHLAAEARRVARPGGGILALGGVRREEGSVRRELRGEMRRRLREHGVEGRSGEKTRRRLIAALEACGASPHVTREAAAWRVASRPRDSIEAWRSKDGLAGMPVAPDLCRRVLDGLEAWARARWGDLEASITSTERYRVTAIRLPQIS